MRIRSITERSRTSKHVSKSVACGLDFEALLFTGSDRHIDITRVRSNAFDWPFLAPELATDNAYSRTVIVCDFRDRAGRNVLVARVRHLERRRQVRPQLKTMHAAMLVALRHFLVKDAAAGGHPLHIPGSHLAFVSQAVPVLDRAGEHIGNGFNPPVWVPRKPRDIICRVLVPEIVEQQKRIEFPGFSETEGTLEFYPRAFNCRLGLNDLFHWAQ